jgi:hypothetical protein
VTSGSFSYPFPFQQTTGKWKSRNTANVIIDEKPHVSKKASAPSLDLLLYELVTCCLEELHVRVVYQLVYVSFRNGLGALPPLLILLQDPRIQESRRADSNR